MIEYVLISYLFRVLTGQGKTIFLQGQGKVREFCIKFLSLLSLLAEKIVASRNIGSVFGPQTALILSAKHKLCENFNYTHIIGPF